MIISGDASGRPCASRFTRESTMIMLALSRRHARLSSEPEPRCVTMALSAEPVARQRHAEAVGHGGERDEHADHQRDAGQRQQRDLPADDDVADVVGNRERHQTCLSIDVMFARYALTAGAKPDSSPIIALKPNMPAAASG